jgi:hypothetical protein
MSRFPEKHLTSHRPKIDLCDLRKSGWCMRLPGGFATVSDESVVIDWGGHQFAIALVRTFPHLGGPREWFECPQCGHRARIVYAPSFACRTCLGLVHPSTRQNSFDRRLSRARQIRRQLGGTGALLEPFPNRPRGMKRATWRRWLEKANRAEGAAITLIEKFISRRPRK